MNNYKTIIVFVGSILGPLLVSGPVNAGIYKCVSPTGNTFYLDKPCPIVAKETEMKAVKDPTNGYIPPALVNLSEDENNVRGAGAKDNDQQGKVKKTRKLSGAANMSGTGGEGVESKQPVAKNKNEGGDSVLVNGGAAPSAVGASKNNEIEPLRMNNY